LASAPAASRALTIGTSLLLHAIWRGVFSACEIVEKKRDLDSKIARHIYIFIKIIYSVIIYK